MIISVIFLGNKVIGSANITVYLSYIPSFRKC